MAKKAAIKQQASAKIDTTGFYKRSADLMEKNKKLNMVDRAVNPKGKPVLKTADGYMTHRMSYAENDKGNFAYPEVVQKKGEKKLTQLKPRDAMKYAEKSGEKIDLGKDAGFAEYFTSVGYKYKQPKQVYDSAMKEYAQRNKRKLTNKRSK